MTHRSKRIGSRGRFRVLLPGRALELEAGSTGAPRDEPRAFLASEIAVEERQLVAAMDRLFAAGHEYLCTLASSSRYPAASFVDEEVLSLTIDDMGASLFRWTRIDVGEHISGLLQ